MRRVMLCALQMAGALMYAASANAAALPADDATISAYRYVLINTTDPTHLIPISIAIRTDPTLRQSEFLDLVAEVTMTIEAQSQYQQFARKELVEQIGRLGGPRYDHTLRKIAAEWAPSPAREKARMFRPGRNTEEQYIPGTIKLARLRQAQITAALAAPAPNDERARHLAAFPIGSTIADLIAYAGEPQAVSSRTPRGDPINLRGYGRMGFYYRGLGRVMFAYRNGRGWIAAGVVVDPLAFENFMPYRAAPAAHQQPDDSTLAMMQLMSGSTVARRLVIDHVEETDTATPEFMDAAAQLLLEHRADTMDDPLADAYAWMCQLLRRDGGPRYAPVLQTVAAAATSDKLRRHASASIESVNPGAPPYVDGAVSLGALRAKYPPLYPQRKFLAGEM